MGEGASPPVVGVQSIGLYPCSLSAHSHTTSSQLPLSVSVPLHFFVVPFGLEFLSPDLPVHTPSAREDGRLSALWIGWGLSYHTRAMSAPCSRAQSGHKQERGPPAYTLLLVRT